MTHRTRRDAAVVSTHYEGAPAAACAAAPGQDAFDGSSNDPTRTVQVVDRPASGRFVLQDADGSRVLVDLDTHLVQSPDGAGVPLPIRYTFCPPEVFVGPSGD